MKPFVSKVPGLLFLLIICNIKAFDWEFYVNRYDLRTKKINSFGSALNHYVNYGIPAKLQGSPIQIENTNFDWIHYIKKNGLVNISSEEQALNHFQEFGRLQNLETNKKFRIAILFHLFNLNLMDEFIKKINYFIRNNPNNEYYIKINIPVDFNIAKFNMNLRTNSKISPNDLKSLAPYHSNLISLENEQKLSEIFSYLNENLLIEKNKLQIIFSENRGQDIGGFFLLLDQLIKEKLEIDYIIKIHTKTRIGWQKILTSFFNIKINKILRQYECVYSCKLVYPDFAFRYHNLLLLDLLKQHNLKPRNFNFCGGTMFIVSSKFIEFVRDWNFEKIFGELNFRKPRSIVLEHAYERFFGYIFDFLKLNTLVLDYYPSNTSN